MQNGFTWGLYVAALAFFVGNAAGGLVLSSSIYLFGAAHLKPFARLGALTAFANVTAAMLIIVPDIGRPERLFEILLHANWMSPLVWDVIVLSAYAVLSLAYLFIMMLPDLRGRLGAALAGRLDDPGAFSDRWSRRLAPFALLFAVSIHVVTAWIFSTQGAREWWFTPALAPDFVAVAVASGTAVVVIAAAIAYGVGREYARAYRSLALIIFGALAVHLFLMFNDFFIHTWFGAEGADELVRLTWSAHPVGHLFEVVAPLVAALLLLAERVRRSVRGLAMSAGLLILGVFVHRFLIMPAAMNLIPLTLQPLGQPGTLWSMPIATGRFSEGVTSFAAHWDYFPSVVEWMIFTASVAFVIVLILLAVAALPVLQGRTADVG
jgi:molybdopterin-containing oxidoreductase family membrane subunit